MYVCIEGIDTSGKSTQIELLKKSFSDAIFTREPGGTELGVKLREILLHQGTSSKKAELFLFLADRAEHAKEVIEPNLDKLIISDRGFVSGIAYTNMYDLEFLIELNSFALNCNFPDKVVLLWLDEDELKKRLSLKKADKIESIGVKKLLSFQSYMKKVLDILHINYLLIDSKKSIDDIHSLIRNFIKD